MECRLFASLLATSNCLLLILLPILLYSLVAGSPGLPVGYYGDEMLCVQFYPTPPQPLAGQLYPPTQRQQRYAPHPPPPPPVVSYAHLPNGGIPAPPFAHYQPSSPVEEQDSDNRTPSPADPPAEEDEVPVGPDYDDSCVELPSERPNGVPDTVDEYDEEEEEEDLKYGDEGGAKDFRRFSGRSRKKTDFFGVQKPAESRGGVGGRGSLKRGRDTSGDPVANRGLTTRANFFPRLTTPPNLCAPAAASRLQDKVALPPKAGQDPVSRNIICNHTDCGRTLNIGVYMLQPQSCMAGLTEEQFNDSPLRLWWYLNEWDMLT